VGARGLWMTEGDGRRRRRWVSEVAAIVALVALATACQQPPTSPTIAERARGCTVGIVGDSLTVGAEPYLGEALTRRGCELSFVNARGGRTTREGVEVVRGLADAGWLPDILVLALGTNDSIDPTKFGTHVQRVMSRIADRPVVWVNIDKPFVEYTLNWTLNAAGALFDNLYVYDWNGVADRFPHLRQADKIHLTDDGYRLRAELIARHLTNR
jgi:lysophospholipase L1-like esterase